MSVAVVCVWIVPLCQAGTPAYKFIQSDICKSSNGRHDAKQRVANSCFGDLGVGP